MNCDVPSAIISSPVPKQIEQAEPGGVTCTKRSSGLTIWSKSTFQPTVVAVERLRPVHVGDGQRDQLDLVVHVLSLRSCSVFQPRDRSGQVLTAFPANLADSLFSGQHVAMPVDVVPYSADWPAAFDRVAVVLRRRSWKCPSATVDLVGSTSVLGLAAKPVLDIDVIVDGPDVPAAVVALDGLGYVHRGDLGVTGREAFGAPDDDPRRHVYVCRSGTLSVRNHLAVRDVLRSRTDLPDEYVAVKLALAAGHAMDTTTYLARKSDVLQKVLAESDLTDAELRVIRRLNDPSAAHGHAPGDDLTPRFTRVRREPSVRWRGCTPRLGRRSAGAGALVRRVPWGPTVKVRPWGLVQV